MPKKKHFWLQDGQCQHPDSYTVLCDEGRRCVFCLKVFQDLQDVQRNRIGFQFNLFQ